MPTLTLSPEPTDAVLLEHVGRGDVRAYELIYNRYRRQAHALAYRLCSRHSVAEEVVQEAFLAVWRRAGTYIESRGSARAWIFTIVHNRAIDECRRHRRVEHGETMLDGPPPRLESSLAPP